MLIRGAEIPGHDERLDVRIEDGRIAAVARALTPRPDEALIEARGAALLPSLHDHHLHLCALAAARASVPCGPPQTMDADTLARALREASARLAEGEWLRGIGYHDSVAGAISRDWLDEVLPERPVRIQHRSGRLWILNTRALTLLQPDAEAPLERVGGRLSGRLYDADGWLRARIGGLRPDLAAVGAELLAHGVTGVTDTSHHNGEGEWRHFAQARARGALPQDLVAMGSAALDEVADGDGLWRGAHKFHLHDHALPEFETLCRDIDRAHRAGRGAAFHCVTRGELVYALAALREAGGNGADRIEHAAVVPPELLAQLRESRVAVVTQPHFIAERGDDYLREVLSEDRPWLYRVRGLLEAGVPVAYGSDAPYGDLNPWRAMQAAVRRRSARDVLMGRDETLTPEQALDLFLAPLATPGLSPRRVVAGAPADLCLLATSWREARMDLSRVRVRLTLKRGVPLYQAPAPAGPRRYGLSGAG
ncbi:MAG: hydrolase [Nevskiaceae bacterium]|nr:MAG: hydrolase [Nevskiaceae bacterium]